MAQRSGVLDRGPSSVPRAGIFSARTVSLRAVLQGKERESIPLRAGNMPGHRAQRFVYALLIAKAFLQHLHGYVLLFELAVQPGAWCGQAGVAMRGPPLSCRSG